MVLQVARLPSSELVSWPPWTMATCTLRLVVVVAASLTLWGAVARRTSLGWTAAVRVAVELCGRAQQQRRPRPRCHHKNRHCGCGRRQQLQPRRRSELLATAVARRALVQHQHWVPHLLLHALVDVEQQVVAQLMLTPLMSTPWRLQPRPLLCFWWRVKLRFLLNTLRQVGQVATSDIPSIPVETRVKNR